jgi:hypothetical protein
MWRLQRRGAILVGLASTLAIVGGLQFALGPKRTNPVVVPGHTLQNSTAIPADVHALLRRACMNCHSNETKWPWYSRIPPLSWGMAHDVAKARQTLNFSEWAGGPGKRPAVAMGYLAAICADVRSKRMPLSTYLLLHPEARLSSQERDAICSWTNSERERYAQLKRRNLVSQNTQ